MAWRPDLLIGHWTNSEGGTGCTVVLTPAGSTGGVHVGGGAPCTRETDIFRVGAGVDPRLVHGVVLSGGSVFGLAATDGAVRWLTKHQIGFRTPHACIPIVGTAGLYDLGFGDPAAWPDATSGAAACEAATTSDWPEGSVGAGTGATVGKAGGMERCTKGGLGIAEVKLANGTTLLAIIAVNAFGEVVDPATGAIVAGVRRLEDEGFQPTSELLGTAAAPILGGTNTTIGVVVTNAALTKEEANELARIAHDGLAQTIRPVHTRVDGDTLFTLATGTGATGIPMMEWIALQDATVRAVAAAILRAVR